MRAQFLIDSLVRQMTVLIAQLATSGGMRAPLAHVANQVFVDLANELQAQGVARKVSADMFGMALRAYIRKIRRLSESGTERGRSLWEAVLDHIEQTGSTDRDAIIERFSHDDPAQVGAVIRDLMDSGLVVPDNGAAATRLRRASDEEMSATDSDGVDELVWVTIYREGPLTREVLAERAPRQAQDLDAILARLEQAGRVSRRRQDGVERLSAQDFTIPLDASAGWEAAVFDHFQAVVQTICQRLDERRAGLEDQVGGSTYSFDIWPGHPLEAEVCECLKRFRAQHGDLRQRVDAYNAQHGRPTEYEQVVMYGGQCRMPQGAEEVDHA